MLNNTNIDMASADRADRDSDAISSKLGIAVKAPGTHGGTFFAHGTELCEVGRKLAKRDRAEFLRLPTVEDGMDELRRAVQAEERADHWVDLGGVSVDYIGRVVTEGDADTRGEIPRLIPSEVGWSRLASFAPNGIPSGLRTNINAWAGKRRGDRVRIRTRLTEESVGAVDESSRDRELYAVVGTGYKPYDLDAIALDVAEHLPSDARVRVRYDRARARIDAVLCNPHYFPDSSGTAGVGEAHRLTLRITTADDGTGGFKLRWSAERIRCINLTLLRGANTVFLAHHTRDDLADSIRAALKVQGAIMEEFAEVWRDAWASYYLDGTRKGSPIGGEEALRRMVYHGLIKIPGLRKPDVWMAVKDAWDAEPGDSTAHLHNAITRAAHQAETTRSWADDEVEEQASELLYQRVHVLAEIPDEVRAELTW